MATTDCACGEIKNGTCGCQDTEGIQTIKDLNEIKSSIFKFTQNEIRRVLFYAGIIKSCIQHAGIIHNFGYVEKDQPCPKCRIASAKKVAENGKVFHVFFLPTPSGSTDGICTVYRAE